MSDDRGVERIRQEIADNSVVLFMKGTPVSPQCGFSAAVVDILSDIGVKFKSVDVLLDPETRESIKAFSNWPTIPQLYVEGEFIGGSDILREMHETGELAQLLSDKRVEQPSGGVHNSPGRLERLADRVRGWRRPSGRHDVTADAPAIVDEALGGRTDGPG